MTIHELQVAIHNLAVSKGWYTGPRSVPELLCLIHSEVSEALEAYRDSPEDHLSSLFSEELADIFIRLVDMAEYLEIDLEKAIIQKHDYNKSRTFRHGNKRC
jgi:NTP pyrophosphatase (non-canonical NTP hydrolase)